ncbi:unnamed protein product [Ceutorhynchus assimilis]|uniref:Uncharacterized protein n=1 Tax=Ceutorhynchus assimilis TaxID=467358 RepID=A0A9N9N0B2_9CUCU|nr:unnamed protein product [Ceutorhynchus assimilis]
MVGDHARYVHVDHLRKCHINNEIESSEETHIPILYKPLNVPPEQANLNLSSDVSEIPNMSNPPIVSVQTSNCDEKNSATKLKINTSSEKMSSPPRQDDSEFSALRRSNREIKKPAKYLE